MNSSNTMLTTTVDEFIVGLCAIRDEDFRIGTVYAYLKQHPVDEHSLEPYLFFSQRQYTRNLIFKNYLFELIALCWETGQASNIHNHAGQNCWMSVPVGRLRIQNFRIVKQVDKTGYCQLKSAEILDIESLTPAEVAPGEPIHQVVNPAEYNDRAVSLHIYSTPFDRCLIYSLQQNRCQEVALRYSSEYGKLCAGVNL